MMQDSRGLGAPSDIGAFEGTVSAIVFQHVFSGVTYVCAARLGDRGWVLVSHLALTGANSTTVIQAAFASLTPGRTWYEQVVVIGNYVDLGQISLPSYIDVYVTGYWKARNALNVHFVINSGNTFIRISGNGTIDGNGSNQAANGDTIRFLTCTYCDVLDLTVWGSARVTDDGETVELENCSNCTVFNLKCFQYQNSYDHIKLTGTSNGCVIAENLCIGPATSNWGSNAIQLAAAPLNNIVANNIIKINDATVSGNGIKVHNGQMNVIIGNTVYGFPADGITLIINASYNFVVGNYVFGSYHATWGGITVRTAGTAVDNVIAENYIRMRDGVNCIGIALDANSLRTRVVRNTVIGGTGVADVGISIITGATGTIILGNDLSSAAIETKIVDAGTATLYPDCKYFTFAISGTLSVGTDQAPSLIVGPAYYLILKVKAVVKIAPIGRAIIADVLRNGVTIFTNPANRPTIADGATYGDSGAPDVNTLVENQVLTVNIAQGGSNIVGSDLTLEALCLSLHG